MAMSGKVSGYVWADSTSNRPVLVGPWMLKHGVPTLRVTDEMRAEDGSFTQTLGYQFAKVLTDIPETPTVTASTRSANGEGTTDIDVSGTNNMMWVRAILFGKSGGAMAGAQSSLQVQTSPRSRILAARTFELQAAINSSQAAYLPLNNPFPALGLTSLMFAVQVFGVDGTTVVFQPIWRTFAARADAPGGWATLDSEQSITTDTLYNSGAEVVSPGAVHLAQVGMKVSGTAGRGTVRVLVSGLF